MGELKNIAFGKKVLKIPKKFPKNFLNVVTRPQKPLPRTLGDKGGVKGGGSVGGTVDYIVPSFTGGTMTEAAYSQPLVPSS